jgi:hypothetical protein
MVLAGIGNFLETDEQLKDLKYFFKAVLTSMRSLI